MSSSSTIAATLAYAGNAYVAGVRPEESSLKPSDGLGTDNRTEEQQLVPVQLDGGALDDLNLGPPLWSPASHNEENKALAPSSNGSTDALSLTLGTCLLPLDLPLCEALDEASLDKDFFEQFVDLNGSFGDVPELDFSELLAQDICQSDVVARTNAVPDVNTYTAPPSPNEALGVLVDADCTSVVPRLPSSPPPTINPSDEITVLETSDTVPASPDCPLPAPSIIGADNVSFDRAIDFNELFKILENPALSTGDSTDITLLSVHMPVAESMQVSSPPPAKKAKRAASVDSCTDSSESASSPAVGSDKSAERRRKNNIASKHARAARKERESKLFLQEEELVRSNAELRMQVEKLTKEAEMLRKLVIERLSRSNTA